MACHLVGAKHYLNKWWILIDHISEFNQNIVEIIQFSLKTFHLNLSSVIVRHFIQAKMS